MTDRYLLDKATLAEYLCISPRTIDERAASGLLPKGKMWGGKLVWRRSDVERHIDATLGLQPTEADIADRVFHATRKQVNGR